MKKELSPQVTGIVIGIAVLAVAIFLYFGVFKPATPPTIQPRPWGPSYGGVPKGPGSQGPTAPAPGAPAPK